MNQGRPAQPAERPPPNAHHPPRRGQLFQGCPVGEHLARGAFGGGPRRRGHVGACGDGRSVGGISFRRGDGVVQECGRVRILVSRALEDGPLSSRRAPVYTCPHSWPLRRSQRRSQHLPGRNRCRPAKSATLRRSRSGARLTPRQPDSRKAQRRQRA